MAIVQLFGYLDKFIYDDSPGVASDQQQALSMGAMLSWSNRHPINVFRIPKMAGLEPLDESRTSLTRWWAVSNREDAIARLEWLMNAGHRSGWPDELEKLKSNATNQGEDNLSQSIPALVQQGVIDNAQGIHRMKIDAWDYGRVVLVARLSCRLGYINEDEALRYIMAAFGRVQEAYETWLDFAKSYLTGRYMWSGTGDATAALHMVNARMFEWKDSPWNRMPLHGPLDARQEDEVRTFVKKMSSHYRDRSWPALLTQSWMTYAVISVALAVFGVSEFASMNAYEHGLSVKLAFPTAYKYAGKSGVLLVFALISIGAGWFAWMKGSRKTLKVTLEK